MAKQPKKMSEMLKEMSERLLRSPDDASSEAAHVALMFAHIAWNEAVGLGNDRSGFLRPGKRLKPTTPKCGVTSSRMT